MAIGSKIIMLYQRVDYSHVALEAGNFYYQANEGKVNKEYKDFFLKDHEVVHAINIPNIELSTIEIVLGRDYATAQNVGILYVDFFKWLGKKVKNPLTSGENCSEFIYEHVLKQFCLDLTLDQNYVKPKHIMRILRERGY